MLKEPNNSMSIEKKTKNIFIADDHKIFVNGLKSMISEFGGYNVVGCESNSMYIMRRLKEKKTDILLLDLNMPEKDGLEILNEIRISDKETKVIILTMYNDDILAQKIKKSGGNAYLLKSLDRYELFDCMENIYTKDFVIGKSVTESKKMNPIFSDNFFDKYKLTKRETEIVKLIVEGQTSMEICNNLFISLNTVETHRKNIFKKLKIKSLSELIHFAYEHQII